MVRRLFSSTKIAIACPLRLPERNSIGLKMAKFLTSINTSGPFFNGVPVAKGTALFLGPMSTEVIIW